MDLFLETLGALAALATIVGFVLGEVRRYKAKRIAKGEWKGASRN